MADSTFVFAAVFRNVDLVLPCHLFRLRAQWEHTQFAHFAATRDQERCDKKLNKTKKSERQCCGVEQKVPPSLVVRDVVVYFGTNSIEQ